MLQLGSGGKESCLKDMKSHLQQIASHGGERYETLLVLSTGIHNYSGTQLGLDLVQQCFALV